MAYDPMEPEELKKMVMMGKKRPMNFAYNPGPKGADLLIIDRIKAADVLGRVAKKQGEGTKVALGTFEIDAKKIVLTAEAVVPGLAKKIRKYLKTLDLSFAVVVLDPNGDEVDADLSDENEQGQEKPGVSQGAAQPDSSTQAEQRENPVETRATRATLSDRLRDLQAPVAALGPAGTAHKKAAAAVVTLLKAGQLDKAETALIKIEASVAKAQESGHDLTPKADGSTEATDAKALVARAVSLKKVLERGPGPQSKTVRNALVQALTALQAKDYAAAENHLIAAENAQNAPTEIDVADQPNTKAQQKWETAFGPIQSRVDAAIQAKTGDLDAINRAFNYAQSQADAGDYESALKSAATTIKLLKEGAQAPEARVEEAATTSPEHVVAYTKSRLNWIKTRTDMQAELVKLKMAIDVQTRGVEGLEEIAQNTSVLLEYIEELDSTLETTLEALVETPDSPAREKLKGEAIGVIGTYRATLDTDFFMAVDDNGFAKTDIRGSALTALSGIETALAA